MAKKKSNTSGKGYKMTINKKTLPLDFLTPIHPDVHKKALGGTPTMMVAPKGKKPKY